MSNKQRILSVDDEAESRELIKYALDEDYDVCFATSGQECLDQFQETQPDVILLDVRMGGLSGYDTCRKLKENSDTSNTPVIFVSAMDSLEERLAGYEAGANDYFVKPFMPEELRTKVRLTLEEKANREQLEESVNNAMQTAMTAMTSTGELGVILTFLGSSFHCDDYVSLGEAILEAMASFQLKCCLQIRGAHDVVEMDYNGKPSAIESSLLSKLAMEKRIFDFGSRTAYNFPRVTILVKNMPLDDLERYGRIKDNLALLAEGADSRISAIDATQAALQRQEILNGILLSVKETIADLDKKYQKHKTTSTHIMEQLLNDIEDSFIQMGLTEQQEHKLLDIVNAAVDNSISLYDQGLELDERLGLLVKTIEDASSN